jgi:hypothetical protein
MLFFLAALVFCEYRWLERENGAKSLPVKQFRFGMQGCVLVIVAQGIYMGLATFLSMNELLIESHCKSDIRCVRRDPLIDYLYVNKIHSFGTITLSFTRWALKAQQSGIHWDTRFNLWLFPKMLQEAERPVAGHAWIMPYVAITLADSLNQKKPEVVFVESGRQYSIAPRHIDLAELLSRTQRFEAAWSHYRYVMQIDECYKQEFSMIKAGCKYDIYRRI